MGEIMKGVRMSNRAKSVCLVSLVAVFLSISMFLSASEEQEKKVPQPKLISLDFGAKEYMRILGGPPETVTMHSGLVVLEPGKSVGKHNTKNYEEVLVVLEGAGEMMITGGPTLDLKGGSIAYCPPRTEHDVICTGSAKLKYVYIVANAE
jgi:quercetin dioxygenase-like cupin family protein